MSETASEALVRLHDEALASDARNDWVRFYQQLAGLALIIPLNGAAGETLRPRLTDHLGVDVITGFLSMERFAEALDGPLDYAEIDGAQLSKMLRGHETPLLVHPDYSSPIMIDPEALGWIAETYGAEVNCSERGEGVTVTAPELPSLDVMEMLGKTVGSLGADCPEAWLVSMTAEDGASELVLVLGLSDGVRAMEGDLADAVTRAVQAVTDARFAVACPDRGSALMATARKRGIGIGG